LESTSARGRILGLDAGERRIGVAISDPDRHFALPLRTVERDRDGTEFAALERLVREEDVTEVVVGLPLSLSGEAGAQAQRATDFADSLRSRLLLPVHMVDERLSTQEAIRRVSDDSRDRHGNRRERSKSQAADTDALAASIILQAYLDRLRFQGSSGA
jgi:putative Holliday junction resolvase